MAAWLDAPVLLVVNAHGAARSLAATVKGFARVRAGHPHRRRDRQPGRLASGTARGWPRRWRRPVCRRSSARVPRGALPTLPSRHLGLVTAEPENLAAGRSSINWPMPAEQHLDVEAIIRLSGVAGSRKAAYVASPGRQPGDGVNSSQIAGYPDAIPGLTPGLHAQSARGSQSPFTPPSAFRLGVAWDEAFHFYYADNLEVLDRARRGNLPLLAAGRCRPAAGPRRPLFRRRLSGAVRGQAGRQPGHALPTSAAAAAAGRPIYAECGGLMYLGRSLATHDGIRHAMAGILPRGDRHARAAQNARLRRGLAAGRFALGTGRGGLPRPRVPLLARSPPMPRPVTVG